MAPEPENPYTDSFAFWQMNAQPRAMSSPGRFAHGRAGVGLA